MVVLIAMLAGVTELVALIGLFGANAARILFGLVRERVRLDRESVDWRPFRYGCLIGAVPWIAITVQLVVTDTGSLARPPWRTALPTSSLTRRCVSATRTALSRPSEP